MNNPVPGEPRRDRVAPPPLPIPSRSPKPRRRRPLVVVNKKRPRRHQPIRKEISAGGVVVRANENDWLVALLKTEHKRGPVWVLPKGHVELQVGERIAEAARREVQEEAGLSDVSVKNQLGVSRFSFQAEGTLVRKTVHYFLMVTNQQILTPQAEEGLLEAAWFPIDEAIKNLTYDTDQDIVARARDQLRGIPSTPRNPDHRHRPPSGRRRASRIHT